MGSYFLFNTKTTPLNVSLHRLLNLLSGIGIKSTYYLIQRFELIKSIFNYNQTLTFFPSNTSKFINILLSKLTNINNAISELQTLTVLRLYLLKTYQGKSHMLGKPVRGQRT